MRHFIAMVTTDTGAGFKLTDTVLQWADLRKLPSVCSESQSAGSGPAPLNVLLTPVLRTSLKHISKTTVFSFQPCLQIPENEQLTCAPWSLLVSDVWSLLCPAYPTLTEELVSSHVSFSFQGMVILWQPLPDFTRIFLTMLTGKHSVCLLGY